MQYRILGPLEVGEFDRTLPLGGAKQRALLALLLLNANRVVSRARLIDELWADEPPETAVTSVHVYVSRLRKLLPSDALVTQPPGYLLQTAPEDVDLHQFERLVAEARSADPEHASRLLREALALWRGPPLAEFSEPFAQVEGGRLEDLRLAAIEERIGSDFALGRHADLIGELEVLIAEHPHRERLRGQLMLALYRSGRQAEAVDVYRQARAALDEVGIEPSEELRQLEKQILTQDTALKAPQVLLSKSPGLPGELGLRPSSPFVGRSGELATLRSLLSLAERGDGGKIVLMRGEAGAGKTRLAREFAHEAAQSGTLVLYGSSDAVLDMPYEPFVEALDFLVRVCDPEALKECLGTGGGDLTRLLPELTQRIGPLPEPLQADPETERYRLHAAVAELLRRVADVRPLLVVIDDAHWADPASLHLLRRLARTVSEARLLLLVQCRDRTEDFRPEFSSTLAELSRIDDVTHITIGSLSQDDVAEFIRRSLRPDSKDELSTLADAVAELTDGTPFLVCELWRALVEARAVEVSDRGVRLTRALAELGSPDSIREVVQYRLSRLAPSTTAMLEVAAIAGQHFELAVLDEALGDQMLGAALEEALQSGMIVEEPGPGLVYRFAHELVRRALYDRLPAVRRADLHLRVGEAIERACGPHLERVLHDLAHHFAAAAPRGGTERAVRYNLRAAEAALGAIAWDEAATRFTTALELGLSEEGERARVQLELARILWIIGPLERAAEVLENALHSADAAGDEQTEWYARLERAGHRSDPAELEAVGREAVPVFERLGDELGLARAHRWIGIAAGRRCLFGQAAEESEHALRHAGALVDRHEETPIVDALCTALLYGPTPAPLGIARCRELLERARGNPLMQAVVLSSLSGLEAMADRLDDARDSHRRARAIYEQLNLGFFIAALSAISGPVDLLAGDPEAAERELRLGIELLAGRANEDAVAYRSALLALTLLAQGRRDAAADALRVAQPLKIMTRITHGLATARVHDDVPAARYAVDVAASTEALNLQADAQATLADLLDARDREEAAYRRRLALRLYEQKGNVIAAHGLRAPQAPATGVSSPRRAPTLG
jgi:DNA-binding SARP family transcriptional activator